MATMDGWEKGDGCYSEREERQEHSDKAGGQKQSQIQ